MQLGDIERYCLLMIEVKLRLGTLDVKLKPPVHDIHPDAEMEFAYLQLRKTLELIALGSLVSNRIAYSVAYTNFENARDARLILRDLERVNPEFYPQPVDKMPNPEPGVRWRLDPIKTPYLTKPKFLKLYERCGLLLHTQNPKRPKLNTATYLTQVAEHRKLILALLNVHTIKLAKSPERYLVHLEEPDGLVHQYTLAPKG